jgi:hypothetical protein
MHIMVILKRPAAAFGLWPSLKFAAVRQTNRERLDYQLDQRSLHICEGLDDFF